MRIAAERTPTRLAILNIVVALAGIILLIFTVRRVGWDSVVSGIASIGWSFVLVVALGAVRMAFRARAWMVCATESGLRFADAFRAFIAGDAMGNLTPLGLFASEPTKILMTRSRITTVTSVASVAIENAFYIASVAIVILAGTWVFLQRAELPSNLAQIAEVIVLAILVGTIAAIWIARTQPALLSRLAPMVTRLAGRTAGSADSVRDVEQRVYGALKWPAARFAHVAAWEAAFHVGAVVEVWIVLRLLPGGQAITLADAFVMETAGRFVTVAFKFIPYRLGIDEAGSGAVAEVLGYGAASGVTLALVRRLRILVLNAIGVVVLIRR